MTLYDDRKHAGQELSDFLKNKIDIDLVVIPYIESYDVGIQVAETQNADVELRLSDFLTSPDAPYAEFGALAEDGTLWVDDSLRKELNVSPEFIEKRAKRLSKHLKRKSRGLARNTGSGKNRKAVIVSDGIGSGFREAAVAGSLLKDGFKEINVATPIKSRNTRADLRSVTTGIFCLHSIPFLSSSKALYKSGTEETKTETRDSRNV